MESEPNFGDAIGELGVEWVHESRVDICWTCSAGGICWRGMVSINDGVNLCEHVN